MLLIKTAIIRRFSLSILFSFAFLSAWAGASAPSKALMLIDEMVFIGPKAGAATLQVKNPTNRAEAYRLNWTNLKMLPGGRKVKIEPGEAVPQLMPADPYMFMSPRRILLMPDQLQHLRLMVRRPAELAPGEYRSYLSLQPEIVPKEFNPDNAEASAKPQGTAVQMDMLTGFRIPVFFLHGDTTLTTSIKDARFGDKGFEFTFVREGNRSALGELEVNCFIDDKKIRLTRTRIQIFTELNSRNYSLQAKDIPPGCGTAYFEYMPHALDPDYTGSPLRLAEVPLQ